MTEKYVGYYRVSTKRQGESGLGLEAQREAVRDFAKKNGTLICEQQDVVSGGSNERTGLIEAMRIAKKEKATILINRLDRFSRRVSFISWFMETGIGLKIVEMPNTDKFQLHIHAAVGEEERRKASHRTREALKVAKEKGVELGKNGKVLAIKNHQQAVDFAKETLELVNSKYSMGMGYTQIAKELNVLGIKSWRGKKFYPSTIKNMVSYVIEKSSIAREGR